jgi:hypothetical protein
MRRDDPHLAHFKPSQNFQPLQPSLTPSTPHQPEYPENLDLTCEASGAQSSRTQGHNPVSPG